MKKKRKDKKVDPALLDYVQASIFEQAKAPLTTSERTETVARVRAMQAQARARAEEREEQSMNDAIETIMSTAEKATGMSREEMMALVPVCEAQRPPPPRRSTRQIAAARGVPELHLRGIVDRQVIECDALTKVRNFIEAEQQLFLVLAGAVGVRKSGSACWALTRREGRYVLAANLPGLASSKEHRDEWNRLRSTPMLLVDELSGEYTDDKGFFAQVLGRLVQERQAACLKTLITYNLDAEAFKRAYGVRIADRINESGVFAEIEGSSVRGHVEHWTNRERGERE